MRAGGRAAELAAGIAARSRAHLSRAITLAESTRPVDRLETAALLRAVPRPTHPAFRIGVSGPPGAGKSTFIEALGVHLLRQQRHVAVLAVDPSSARTGGSILGDKTRMVELSRSDSAYVRPSPTRGTLGGVTRRTTEAILLCESAGYDPVMVETVGVGQSETAVEDMVDVFLLLVSPAGGDDLQGIKKGVVELADIIAVNKADGPLVRCVRFLGHALNVYSPLLPSYLLFAEPTQDATLLSDLTALQKDVAKRTQTDYAKAIHLFRPKVPHWTPPVLLCSAQTGEGIDGIWQALQEFQKCSEESGEFERRRAAQRRSWLWKMLNEELAEHFIRHPRVRPLLPRMEADVAKGLLTPGAAADWLLAEFEGSIREHPKI